MHREKKQLETEGQAGAPLWMVTFCDSMTLMLTFFVLLFSFSSFNEDVFEKLAMCFNKALSAPNPLFKKDWGAFLPTEQIVATEEIGEGSEKPTIARGWDDHLREETEPSDFHSRKVFLLPSKDVFLGKGSAISLEGRNTLATMARFLKERPSRIVISENGPGDDVSSNQLGLLRAWAVMEYLTAKQGLEKNWFSISATSTLAKQKAERELEIVLLERSIYN